MFYASASMFLALTFVARLVLMDDLKCLMFQDV